MLELLLNPIVLAVLMIWSMFWMGLALWRAGTRKEKIWFLFFFLVHTAGLLEIIYLYITMPKKKRKK